MKQLFLILLFIFSGFQFLFSQNNELIQIKGIVVNLKMEPVSFAHVLVKNKRIGTISDPDGKFDFFTNKGDTLVVSCVGYKKSIYFIPEITEYKIYHLLAVLHNDTLKLPEVIIFPWKNYNEFVQCFIKTKVPDDDIVRAEKNFELIKLQILLDDDDLPSSPGAAYNISMQERNSALYWKGQTQPMQIFNVFAWQQFFEYLKEGKFKNKKKAKEKDENY